MKINSVGLDITAVRRSQYPDDDLPEFLMVGRSNVGKSSFVNTLVSRKNLARTSARPGKTQTLNFYLVNDTFYLVDVPGYGYAAVNKEQQKKFGMLIEEYIKNRHELKILISQSQQSWDDRPSSEYCPTIHEIINQNMF